MIVDGANVGLFNQNFGEGGFNFYQVFVSYSMNDNKMFGMLLCDCVA